MECTYYVSHSSKMCLHLLLLALIIPSSVEGQICLYINFENMLIAQLSKALYLRLNTMISQIMWFQSQQRQSPSVFWGPI